MDGSHFENGIRTVRPYFHEYKTAFRERWRQRTPVQILCGEFGQQQPAVDRAIDAGRIFVTTNNGRSGGVGKVDGDAVRRHGLQPHDVIHNEQHTHEPDVRMEWRRLEDGETAARLTARFDAIRGLGKSGLEKSGPEESGPEKSGPEKSGPGNICPASDAVPILFQSPSVVVVNKPPGIPTHPGGIYRLNTVTEIVARSLHRPVFPCHRLDKSTSGVLVLATSSAAAAQTTAALRRKDAVHKWYVARVQGRFPHAHLAYTCPVFAVNCSGAGYLSAPSDRVPTDSTTEFHLLAAYASESLVLCRPVSGRTHQIRIHLRNLGHPIANDGFYAGAAAREKNAVELELYRLLQQRWPDAVRAETLGVRSAAAADVDAPAAAAAAASLARGGCAGSPKTGATISVASLLTREHEREISRLAAAKTHAAAQRQSGACAECSCPLYAAEPDPGIWLHALALCGPGLDFFADWPAWCARSPP